MGNASGKCIINTFLTNTIGEDNKKKLQHRRDVFTSTDSSALFKNFVNDMIHCKHRRFERWPYVPIFIAL